MYCNVTRHTVHTEHRYRVSPCVLPDDKTRVRLEMKENDKLSDYINASHIQVLYLTQIAHKTLFVF